MNLAVSNHIEGKHGLIQLSVDDILYFEFERSKEMIVLHTLTDKFFTPGTLKFWVEALKASGYHFEMVDRINAVNLCRIRHVDQKYKLAYFEDVIKKDSKRCTVSINNINTVLQALGQNVLSFATS